MKPFFRVVLHFFREADIYLLVLSILGSVYGIVMVSSVGRNLSSNLLAVQIGATVIGLALFVLFSYIDIDIIADKPRILFIFSVILISTLFLFGVGEQEVGSRGWIRFWSIGIQPAEIVKVPFIIIIARMISISKERRTLNNVSSLAQIMIVALILLVLIVVSSDDVGSALVYVVILLTMLFVGDVKLRWFLLGGGILAALTPLIWFNFLQKYQRDRILAPFTPETVDPGRQGVLWQPDLSVKAIASGGFTGQGLGKGRITQASVIWGQHTDFMFSAVGEELGFVGCLLVMLLLVLIIIRCIYVGVKSNNPLGLLVCSGIAAMLIAQTVENIGMCLGVLPVIGITLPFLSYGGSSIVTCLAAMGIVSGIKMRPKPVRFRTTWN